MKIYVACTQHHKQPFRDVLGKKKSFGDIIYICEKKCKGVHFFKNVASQKPGTLLTPGLKLYKAWNFIKIRFISCTIRQRHWHMRDEEADLYL